VSINGVGLDIGTNMIVHAKMNEAGEVVYKKQRDAFFKITPKSEINRKAIRKALEGRNSNFIIDENKDFIVVGEDALHMANERNMEARRPMSKGVLSPREKSSMPMIKLIIKSLTGRSENSDKLVFSIPAEPIDGNFDIFYHESLIKMYLKEMGFDASSLNESFAIAFSELLDDNLTGACISFGAGMINTAVIYEGDPIIQFSITKGGDWIDSSVAKALDLNPSLVQIEKEEDNIDILKPVGKIQEAISVYYNVLIDYALDNIVFELERHSLPSFRDPIPIVTSGGLSLIGNFVEKFTIAAKNKKFPFEIKEVRRAKDPMTCVAHGCLMAAIL
jgi:actin-like ATPase involved in cell morphogenesis